jgi:hypothetical protein
MSISFLNSPTNRFLQNTDIGLPTGAATYISISKSNSASISSPAYQNIFNYGNAALNQNVFVLYASDPSLGTNATSFSNFGDGFGINNRLQQTNLFFGTKPATTGTWNLWVNNTLSASKSMTTTTTLNTGTGSFRVGAFSQPVGGGSALFGEISEIIIYPSNQSSNRTGIENNINTYYSIY